MQAEVDARDAEIARLTEQVQSLSRQVSPRAGSPKPFSAFPAGTPRSKSPRGRSASPHGTRSPRASSPRPMHAFGSSVTSSRKKPMSPEQFFHASMRGGALTEPMPQRGLTDRERIDPSLIRGPSLLTRDRFGAKKSEWVKYKELALGNGDDGGNFLEDDNPFNDPFKYHPFKGMVFPPGDYIGPDDSRETDDMRSLKPGNALKLQFVYGYTSRKGCRQNLFYNKDGHIVYHCAALGVVYDKEKHEQYYFHGHDDDITALALNPKDRLTIATGQLGEYTHYSSPAPLVPHTASVRALLTVACVHCVLQARTPRFSCGVRGPTRALATCRSCASSTATTSAQSSACRST